MPRQLLTLWHLFPILLISLMVLSTHLSWAQKTLPLQEIPARFFDRAVQPVPEATTPLRPVSGELPLLSFAANRGQTESPVSFFPRRSSYDHMPINYKATLELQRRTGTAELLGKTKYFIGSAPSKWPTFAPAYDKMHDRTVHRANDLEYYGLHTPWAGSMILRICQQAKAHPHVTRVLKLLKPRF